MGVMENDQDEMEWVAKTDEMSVGHVGIKSMA
jgi:hypothetical protein